MTAPALGTLLVVDDEAPQLLALCNVLGDQGYEVVGCSSADEALAKLREKDFDILLTDLQMPQTDGITLLKEAQKIRPDIAGVLMTGHGSIDSAVAAMKVGALDYVLKPFKLSTAIPILARAVEIKRAAKSLGMGHAYYSSQIDARIAERIDLAAQLRAALDAGQFVLHYQPRVDMASGELVGAEALIRWQHPQRGLVAPAEFIELAEETGLIVPIGAWVIRAVCAQQAGWIAAGLDTVPVAVNVSAIQLDKSDVLKTVRDALAEYALDAKHLELELTESAVIGYGTTAETLRGLKRAGVKLALDDFGTGYSSLSLLKRFPFHSVKIDQSFVSGITHDTEDAAIATAIIAMAHRMNLKVVAEGVDTQGQFTYLRNHACDEMQGHFFSAAVAKDAFESQLRIHRRLSVPPTNSGEQRAILLVDDEAGIRSALTRMLRSDGYRIFTAAGGAEGLEILAVNEVQVIISDQRMPGMSGTEFLDIVKQLHPETVRIILSGYTDLEVVTDSVNRGAVFKFLTKPWNDDLLRQQVRDAFRHFRSAES
jgi:EAL domain-containing protein (putative c-di-GMP-specific phosphodiesterase class I)/FixJ family two-component response regulator